MDVVLTSLRFPPLVQAAMGCLPIQLQASCSRPLVVTNPFLELAVLEGGRQRRERRDRRRSTSLQIYSSSVHHRPVVILPGLGNNSNDYALLASSLEEKGFCTSVAQVSRFDWLRNALGLLDKNYWLGKLSPRPVLDWYLERVNKAIWGAKSAARGGDGKVSVVGHSAGGWLARLYMSEIGIDDVAVLISLGTPHLPPPKGVSGVVDQTRGLLDYINEVCPGTCFAPDVTYICIAGRYIKGERVFPTKVPAVASAEVGTIIVPREQELLSMEKNLLGGSMDGVNRERNTGRPTIRARFVGQGYKQVCGQADVWGDGVVPEISAHLGGAKNITLDGVYHSPVGSNDPERPWYGSPSVLEQWIYHLY